MDEPKVTKSVNVRGKRILLESTGDHRMFLDVMETGEIVLHELFGVPGAEPTTLAELTDQMQSCYHVTICIKGRYVAPLVDFLKQDGLFTFPEAPKPVDEEKKE